jgi:hypothetical protein
MQLMTATPHSDTAFTDEKDLSDIVVKNASEGVNSHINRNSCPR